MLTVPQLAKSRQHTPEIFANFQVARDIEDPFHYDPNELPLPQLQYRLNERLLSVSLSRRPIAFTDVGELTGPGNTINFNPPSADVLSLIHI